MFLQKEYQTFDELMRKDGEEQEINELFGNILQQAVDVFNTKTQNEEFLQYPEDKYVIRALFEYILELWSEGAFEDAKNLGYDLVYMVDDENLKEAFSMFVLGLIDKMPLDKFLERYVDFDGTDERYDMFFTAFHDDIDELIIKHRETFKKEFSE
ncbi:MAG: hypothetical protein GXO40_06825 [Epsilonproteobacteria bacterium]|nr:hypothetical protein [Campylobacterota bacterium]